MKILKDSDQNFGIVFPGSYNVIVSCSNTQFCCLAGFDTRSCCTAASNLFVLQAASTMTIIGVTMSISGTELRSSVTSRPVFTSNSASALVSLTTSGVVSIVNNGPAGKSNSERNVGIGVRVGLGTGATLLVVVFFVLRRRRKQKQDSVVEQAGTEVRQTQR